MNLNFLNITNTGEYKPFIPSKNVIIGFGQSNFTGRQSGTTYPVDIPNPNPKIQTWDNNSFRDYDYTKIPEGDADESPGTIAYGWKAIALNGLADDTGETIYFVTKNAGGTGLIMRDAVTAPKGDWNVHSRESVDHFVTFNRRVKNIKTFVEIGEGLRFNCPAILVDICETDSTHSNYETAFRDYSQFFNEIRKTIDDPNCPILHRKTSVNQSSFVQWFEDMQYDFQNGAINNYEVIEADDAELQIDNLHFNQNGCLTIGNRVRNRLLELY